MSEPLLLPRNCGNCQHFDGWAHCALPQRLGLVLIPRIVNHELVVCAKHEPKTADDVEGAAV